MLFRCDILLVGTPHYWVCWPTVDYHTGLSYCCHAGYVTSPKVESVKFRQLTPIAWQGELLALECRATPSDIVIKLLRVHAFHDDLNTQELVFKYVGDVYNTHDFSGAWLGRGQSLLDGAGMYINVTSATVKQDGGRFNCEIREDDNTSEEDNNGYVMINGEIATYQTQRVTGH